MDVIPIEGKGLGAISIEKHDRGDLIAKESPVLQWDSLKYHIIEQLDIVLSNNMIMKQLAELSPSTSDYINSTRYKQLSNIVEAIAIKHKVSVDDAILFYLRLESNAFPSGICVTIARVNHSCIPNAKVEEYENEDGTLEFQLVALKDIEAREEIVISYLEAPALMTQNERKRHLYNQYYFDCSCPRCISDGIFKCRNKVGSLECKGKIGSSRKKCDNCGKIFTDKEIQKIETKIDKLLGDIRTTTIGPPGKVMPMNSEDKKRYLLGAMRQFKSGFDMEM